MDLYKKSWMSRVGIVIIAALLVEAISIVQYQRLQSIMEEEMNERFRVVLNAMSAEVDNMMELTEATMNENMWVVRRNLQHPDSVFSALFYMINDNPHVVGGCLAFVPDYYPSKGRLFEPYASKNNGKISIEQIAGVNHDYTQNEFYRKVVETGQAYWSTPYVYGKDSISYLITYTHPVTDSKGKLAAVCGLDIELTWLGDTLNAHQPYASSFGLLLTQDGTLVAAPPVSRTAPAEVELALSLLRDGKEETRDKTMAVRSTLMDREPYWQIVEVYHTDEAFARMRKMRLQQAVLILLGLAILFFLITLFARREKRLRDATAEQARLSGELEVARRIQQEMLPEAFPSNIFGLLEPAREVGGDLYDFYIRDGKLFFCIGDVSGKGVPSAMLMSVVHSLFRMVSQREELPSRILKALNTQICSENDANMFVTFFVGCLDLYTGHLHYSNAGHDKPFLLGDSAITLPVKSNLPLGVFPDTVFEEQTMVLSPGKSLFLFTDGLTEAKRADRQAFGRKRVEEVMNACLVEGNATPESLVHSLLKANHSFVGSAPQSDDLTMLLVRFQPGDLLQDEITFSNNLDEIVRFSQFVLNFCRQLGLSQKMSSHIRLALEEAVVNVMNYAYPAGEKGFVTVFADSNRKEVRYTVVDTGYPFDPTSVLSSDTSLDAQNRPVGGLGILLSRKLMDSVSYCRKDGQNVLTLTKLIV